MGAFFTNYQIRCKSTSEVCTALTPLVDEIAYVSPQKGGWVTVYDFASDSLDPKILNRVAAKLSKTLDTAVFAFLVHDSDIAVYWLYQDGVLEDEFDSCPDYFSAVSEGEKSRLHGKVEKLLPHCIAGTSRAQVEEVIHPDDDFPVFAEEILNNLLKLLGIDEARMNLRFRHFEQEGHKLLDDASEFITIGKRAPKNKSQPPKRAAKRWR